MPDLRSSCCYLRRWLKMWYCRFLPSVGTYPPDYTMSQCAHSTSVGKPNGKKRPTHTTRGKKFDVLTSVSTRTQNVWNVMLYHSVNGCRHSAETSAATHHPATQRHIPGYLNPYEMSQDWGFWLQHSFTMRSLLFGDITRCWLEAIDVSRQPMGSIFKDQPVQEEILFYVAVEP